MERHRHQIGKTVHGLHASASIDIKDVGIQPCRRGCVDQLRTRTQCKRLFMSGDFPRWKPCICGAPEVLVEFGNPKELSRKQSPVLNERSTTQNQHHQRHIEEQVTAQPQPHSGCLSVSVCKADFDGDSHCTNRRTTEATVLCCSISLAYSVLSRGKQYTSRLYL
jgi:hypothetical protein